MLKKAPTPLLLALTPLLLVLTLLLLVPKLLLRPTLLLLRPLLLRLTPLLLRPLRLKKRSKSQPLGALAETKKGGLPSGRPLFAYRIRQPRRGRAGSPPCPALRSFYPATIVRPSLRSSASSTCCSSSDKPDSIRVSIAISLRKTVSTSANPAGVSSASRLRPSSAAGGRLIEARHFEFRQPRRQAARRHHHRRIHFGRTHPVWRPRTAKRREDVERPAVETMFFHHLQDRRPHPRR